MEKFGSRGGSLPVSGRSCFVRLHGQGMKTTRVNSLGALDGSTVPCPMEFDCRSKGGSTRPYGQNAPGATPRHGLGTGAHPWAHKPPAECWRTEEGEKTHCWQTEGKKNSLHTSTTREKMSEGSLIDLRNTVVQLEVLKFNEYMGIRDVDHHSRNCVSMRAGSGCR